MRSLRICAKLLLLLGALGACLVSWNTACCGGSAALSGGAGGRLKGTGGGATGSRMGGGALPLAALPGPLAGCSDARKSALGAAAVHLPGPRPRPRPRPLPPPGIDCTHVSVLVDYYPTQS